MPKTLLLADDSKTIQQAVSMTFAGEDVKLITASDGEAALQAAKQSRPDLILADVLMPRLGGYELCQRVRADAALKDVPVLLLGGQGHGGRCQRPHAEAVRQRETDRARQDHPGESKGETGHCSGRRSSGEARSGRRASVGASNRDKARRLPGGKREHDGDAPAPHARRSAVETCFFQSAASAFRTRDFRAARGRKTAPGKAAGYRPTPRAHICFPALDAGARAACRAPSEAASGCLETASAAGHR